MVLEQVTGDISMEMLRSEDRVLWSSQSITGHYPEQIGGVFGIDTVD